MNIRLVLDELFHADRWTDVMKLIAAFRDFSCASKNSREALIFQLEAPRFIGNFSDTGNVRVVGTKNCRIECVLPKSYDKRTL
jgi:hypothetical protein